MKKIYNYDGFRIIELDNNTYTYFHNLCIIEVKMRLDRIFRYCRRLAELENISFLVHERERSCEVVLLSKLVQPDSSEGEYLMRLFGASEAYIQTIQYENAWITPVTEKINSRQYILSKLEKDVLQREPHNVLNIFRFVRSNFKPSKPLVHTPHQYNKKDQFDYVNR